MPQPIDRLVDLDRTRAALEERSAGCNFCGVAGVPDFRPHDLRHIFTSVLQAQGVSDSVIMSITGHKTHVILHRYSHSDDQMRRDAVEGLPEPPDMRPGYRKTAAR